MLLRIADVFSGKYDEMEVSLRGWIYRTRSTATAVFAVLRDSSGIIQIPVFKADVAEEVFLKAKDTLIESSVIVTGRVVKDSRAPGGYEVHVKQWEVVGAAERYPITKDQSEEWLRENRHLWLRSRKMAAILKVRSTVTGAIHEFFRARGYYEFTPPIFTPNACEGGATLFEVKYYDSKVYMTQSWQLYAEAMIFSLEKIYDVSPTFRAEKSKTSRHLCEFWMAEMEEAWIGYREAIQIAFDELKYIIRSVLEKNRAELEFMKADIPKLESMLKKEWPVITYTEVVERLSKHAPYLERVASEKTASPIRWGEDLRTIEEEEIMKFYDTPVAVINYPKEIMAFYKPVDIEASKHTPGPVCKNFDILAPDGYGEIVGGSERDTDIESLKKALEKEGEKIENYEWYLDLRRYGSVPHSVYGIGVERVISWICRLDNIKDAIAFPRTSTRWTP
ncbi:MAG: asparagine--tRNA ligase [Thermoplasmata archaeon]